MVTAGGWPCGRWEPSVLSMSELTVYGTTWCSDCKRAKQLLGEQRVPYVFVDIDTDEAGLAYVQEVNQGKSIIPVVLFEDGSTLVEPSNAELAAKLGITPEARTRLPGRAAGRTGPGRPAPWGGGRARRRPGRWPTWPARRTPTRRTGCVRIRGRRGSPD